MISCIGSSSPQAVATRKLGLSIWIARVQGLIRLSWSSAIALAPYLFACVAARGVCHLTNLSRERAHGLGISPELPALKLTPIPNPKTTKRLLSLGFPAYQKAYARQPQGGRAILSSGGDTGRGAGSNPTRGRARVPTSVRFAGHHEQRSRAHRGGQPKVRSVQCAHPTRIVGNENHQLEGKIVRIRRDSVGFIVASSRGAPLQATKKRLHDASTRSRGLRTHY